MRITRIDFEGRSGRYATALRQQDSEFIEITILTPELERTHHVNADDRDDQYSAADAVSYALEGRCTNSMIHDYFREIQRLGDC